MKTIKSLTALSLFAAASISNAAVWDVEVSASTYFPQANGHIIYNAQGTWDDATHQGTLNGDLNLYGFGVVLNLSEQPFFMDAATGIGTLYKAVGCTDNISGDGCLSTAPYFIGSMLNDITFGGTPDTSSATPFAPVDNGSYTWTLLFASTDAGSSEPVYRNYPLTVTLHATVPTVPVPATAWLFGSGVLGLAGMGRRRAK